MPFAFVKRKYRLKNICVENFNKTKMKKMHTFNKMESATLILFECSPILKSGKTIERWRRKAIGTNDYHVYAVIDVSQLPVIRVISDIVNA